MILRLLTGFIFFSISVFGFAQMQIGENTVFGNEWINYELEYYKIKVAEDGIYRVTYEELVAVGISPNSIVGRNMQVFAFGEEIPIRTSEQNLFAPGDYFEFYGKKNKGELDRHIYDEPEQMQLNPLYSVINDTSAYFLTISPLEIGRRYDQKNNDLNSGLPPREAFYIHCEQVVFNEYHLKPSRNGTDRIRFSSFDVSEGYGSDLKRTHKIDFDITHKFEEGPNPNIKIRFGGNSVTHLPQLSINSELIKTLTYSGYMVNEFDEFFNLENLTDKTEVEIYGSASNNDRYVLAHATLTYPRAFNFTDKNYVELELNEDVITKYIEAEAFNASAENTIIYNLDEEYFLFPQSDEGILKFIIPPHEEKRTIAILDLNNGIKRVSGIRKIVFEDYSIIDPNYIILSNSKLEKDPESETNWIQEYADYRESEAGGAHQVKIIDINQLYDQFAFGVDRHFIAIRNFAHFFKSQWSDPKFFFIIGKAKEYPLIRTSEQLADPQNDDFFVPTYGQPGSDNVLISTPGEVVPLVPIGRIAVRSAKEIKFYLDKIKLHENPLSNNQTIEDQLWKKRIIHLSGGDAFIQEIIYNFLKDMENTIIDSPFGARVTTFRKTSADPIQTATSDRIINEINNGVSFITFFGHSAVGTFDFSLEEPGKYDNYGKYPMIISLGCHSGNIHSEGIGLSEDFVLEEEKGSIAFFASSGSAYISPQYNSGKDFYEFVGKSLLGESIGKIIQEALKKRGNNDNLSVKTLNEQLTLHGDPAVKMHPREGADFTTSFESVNINPPIVSTNIDSFKLSFDAVNLGIGIEDSMQILARHFTPEGELFSEKKLKIKTPLFSDNVSLNMQVPGISGLGKNTIKISLDIENKITETPSPDAEQNNELINQEGEEGFNFFVLDNGVKPVYPNEFAIIPTNDLILKASTSNAFLEDQNYIFEIDTTANFNSPALLQHEIIQGGGIIQWKPDIDPTPGRAYYWRVSPDSVLTNVGYIWEESSFIYLPEEEGWNQSHYFQLLTDDYSGLVLPGNRKLQFDTAGFFISVHNRIFNPATPPGFQFNFETFAASVRPWDFMDSGIAIAVTDGITGDGWTNSGGDYGSIDTRSFSSFRVFGFNTDTPEDRKAIMDFIEDNIPTGNHVYLWTVLKDSNSDFQPELWEEDINLYGKNLFSVLESQGARFVSELKTKGSIPYNFIFIKDGEVLGEGAADSKEGFIKTDVFIPVLGIEGELKSNLIGPAKSWQSLEWSYSDKELNDSIYLRIIGVDAEKQEIILQDKIKATNYDLQEIDAADYPFLRLELYTKDDIYRSAVNLDYWRILYTGLPEAAINTEARFVFHSDTLQQGDNLRAEVGIDNLSTTDMDSLLIKYSILDTKNNEEIKVERVEPLLQNNSLIATFSRSTTDLSGEYQFTIEINPGKDQAEQYSFNNFGITNFYVEKDGSNPILNVTFDGMQIFNGDIVSPQPIIVIELKDENPYLPINDISLFEIALEYPDGVLQNIPVDDPRVEFFPAEQGGDKNQAKLHFSPQLSEGDYKLYVQAKDASGNFSGENNYEVSFRVIEATSISNVLNYPNPFSSSTQFVFTLTGEIPNVFTIRIMTLTGKVVREIKREELGDIHIGVNRTDYRWDGTDDFGQKLANGVYLYQVITKTNNTLEDYSKFETSSNRFFKEDFGKLVIMR